MSKFARIENGGRVREIIVVDKLPPFTPDVAKQFKLVPEEVESGVKEGWVFDGAKYKPDTETNLNDPFPARLAALRWMKETDGGVTWNGRQIHTDRESQNRLIAVYLKARDGHWGAGSVWKFKEGFAVLTAKQIIEMAAAVFEYVEACYRTEARKYAQWLLEPEVAEVNINEGWPSPALLSQ